MFSSGGTRIKGEPISIFKEITQEKDQQKKQNLEGLLNELKTSYPNDLKIGAALKTGDCFFDSVAQGLNELKSGHRFTAKSLREVCKEFAQSQLGNDQSWLKEALENESEQIDDYIPRIEFTANDIKQKSELAIVLVLASPIWGRLDIEGRMICEKYKVKIEVIELLEKPIEESTKNRHVIRSKQCEGNNVVRIVNYKMHFVPLLNNLEKDIEKATEVSKEEVYGMEDIENHDFVTPADVYNKLNRLEFNGDDEGNPHTWAGSNQINSFINDRAIKNTDGSELAYYIAPSNFGFNDEESMKVIAQHICKKISKDGDTIINYKSDKPAIVISNTVTTLGESSRDTSKQGGSHWIGWVLLPKEYDSLSGKKINNDKYQVLFF